MIKTDILAYIAGYIDGDGCFNIRKQSFERRFKYSNQLIVTSTNEEIVKFLKRKLGGNYTRVDTSKRPKNWKPQFRYTIHGKAAGRIARAIYPFLVEKRHQAQCFFEFSETNDKSVKDHLIETITSLKHSTDHVSKQDIQHLKTMSNSIQPVLTDFSYLAGFIDAECCLGLSRYRTANRPNYLHKAVLSLNNTKLPCFYFLVGRFGGSLAFVPKKGNSRCQLHWKLTSKKLHEILPKLYPFLRAKKPVCIELMKFSDLILPNGGARHTESFRQAYQANLIERDKIFKSIHILNHKGLLSI